MTLLLYLILITACFLYFFIHTKSKIYIKLFAILLLSHGYLTVYSSVETLSGYPTKEEMPEVVQVLWGVAVEPIPVEDFPGYIDLWVIHTPTIEEGWMDWFSLAERNKVSRIYRIDYTKKNHESLKALTDRLKKGKHVGLTIDKKSNNSIDISEAQQRYSINYNSIRIEK